VGKDLGNGIKVFLTAVASVVPGVGQLIGVIAALIYMNAEEDADRNSFGRALLAASLIMFVLTCITWLAIASALYNS
jgi:multisubunit Na+/H+ antiporter MnhG subunit